jgi:anti-sigma-K factor RskA
MSPHIGDDAECYALGLLDAARRAEIDAHVASCDSCLRLIGGAEETAAALASVLPGAKPSVRLAGTFGPGRRRAPVERYGWIAGLAVAATFIVALGTSWNQTGVLRGALQADQLAVATLVHSHFLHVTMTAAPAAGPLAAKVVYARDGTWLYVLVDHPSGPIDVEAKIGGKSWSAGRATSNGGTATLFVRPPGRPESVELTQDGAPVASAKLVY